MRKTAFLLLFVSSLCFDAKPMCKRQKIEVAEAIPVGSLLALTDWSLRMVLINDIYNSDFENNYADLEKLFKYITFPSKRIREMVQTNVPLKIKMKVTDSDRELEMLTRMFSKNQIIELYLRETQITDLAPLAELTNLRVLDLSGTQITDAGLAHLAGLTNLKVLNIGETGITDAELVHLAGLTNLQELDLTGCQGITDVGVEALKEKLPDLNVIH